GTQADDLEQFGDALFARGGVAEAVDGERLVEDLAHGHARIERRVGILEDDLRALAERAQRAGGGPGDVGAVDDHAARARLVQTQDGAADRRLAAARLADEAQRLAGGDVERDAVDGLDDALAAAEEAGPRGEVLGQVLDGDEGVAHDSTGKKQRTNRPGS